MNPILPDSNQRQGSSDGVKSKQRGENERNKTGRDSQTDTAPDS